MRSKKELIETFLAGINDVDDVMTEWHHYVGEEREKQLLHIVQEEKLKEPEPRKFLQNAFLDGEIRTTGTNIDKLMPPVSRFGGGKRAEKKLRVIEKLKAFFERFCIMARLQRKITCVWCGERSDLITKHLTGVKTISVRTQVAAYLYLKRILTLINILA